MVTTREAAPAVRLNAAWQAKYRQRAQQFLLHHQKHESISGHHASDGALPSVCIVGRSGVGKGSLVNHLLKARASKASRFELDSEERTFDFRGLIHIREIPGYDGWHTSMEPPKRSSRHGSKNHSSNGHGSSSGKGQKLNLDEFVKRYGLFEDHTKAIIFLVNSKITPDDEKLMELAVENRKFFSIVCTHADDLVKHADSGLLKRRLDDVEEQLRKDLCLIQRLNVRVFILSIPFPDGQATGTKLEGADLKCVTENSLNLHFPLLQAYLSEPRGLLDELQIHGFVKEEVSIALEPFRNVKKRHQFVDFSEHLVAGVLLPIAGPVMVSFVKTLRCTLRACFDVGLIQDLEGAMKEVDADASKHGLSALMASKEGVVTAVHDSMIHIFGEIVYDIAIKEVVSASAEAAFSETLPLLGPIISAAHLPKRFIKIAEKLAMKACMLHELWMMQNVTGLLGTE